MTLELVEGVTVTGLVREADGKTPIAPVDVYVVSPAEIYDSNTSDVAFRFPNFAGYSASSRVEVFQTHCTDNGGFTWNHAPPGRFFAFAASDTGIESDFEEIAVSKNGSVQPLALRLPIRCFLSGRIQPMAIERNTKQLCAEITYTKKYVNAPADRRGNNLCFVVKCDANGEFKFSGLPVGNAHLAIGELKGAIDGQVSGVMPGDSLGSTLHEMDLVVRDGDRISIPK